VKGSPHFNSGIAVSTSEANASSNVTATGFMLGGIGPLKSDGTGVRASQGNPFASETCLSLSSRRGDNTGSRNHAMLIP
jgi:hypothetical protein